MTQSRLWTRLASGGTALTRLPPLVRTHWLFTLVMLIGTAGRVLTMVAYQPALLYIDSSGYLNNRFNLNPTGSQPIGYSLLLRLLLYVGDLSMIAPTLAADDAEEGFWRFHLSRSDLSSG